jgi:hypothetical protein
MSDKTKADLEAAISAHITDEFGEPTMLTGWILQACGQTVTDSRWSNIYTGMTGMSMIVANGLLAYITDRVQGLSSFGEWEPGNDEGD